MLQQGLALHNAGQLDQAKVIYEGILKLNARHFDALQLLATLAAQTGQWNLSLTLLDEALQINKTHPATYNIKGTVLNTLQRFEEALTIYDRAIALKPDYVEAHFNRGNTLKDINRLEDALTSYDRAIALKPDYAEAYSNRGVVLKELNRLDEALECHDRVITLKPDFVGAHLNRGMVLKDLKRLEEAIASYDRAIALKLDYAEAYSNRGIVLKELNRLEEALSSCEKAIALNPDFAKAYSVRGGVLNELNRLEEALSSYDRAIALNPDYAEAYSNRGNALKDLKRLEEALTSYERAIALKPDYAEAYLNRGVLLGDLNRLEEALSSCEKAIALNPDFAKAYSDRGVVLQELNRLEEALSSYDRAIALNLDFADPNFNASLALLLKGQFLSGFSKYEVRWKVESNKDTIGGRHLTQPLWLGKESLANKKILLWSEQGLGDSIQFCRYAKLVKSLGATVFLDVPKPLVALLGHLEGVDLLIENGTPLPDFDYQCPLLSLPLAFKTELHSIPSPAPYLKSDDTKLKLWGQLLGVKSKPRVGLVWSGSTQHKGDRNRSLSLASLLEHLPPDFEYFSLQKEVREKDKDALAKSNIKHFGERLIDFSDTAALCELMDLVISVDTSVAHLSGALGKETWVLLPYAPDWRWLLDRDDSPWYESVKLYRQTEDRLYAPVLERMALDLSELMEPVLS